MKNLKIFYARTVHVGVQKNYSQLLKLKIQQAIQVCHLPLMYRTLNSAFSES